MYHNGEFVMYKKPVPADVSGDGLCRFYLSGTLV